jgi:hypothetical protein
LSLRQLHDSPVLAGEHALEGRDAAFVERRAGISVQERQRVLVRPRIAIDAWRDERVVDVAHGHDACVEAQVALAQPPRIALPVEPLVVAVHELVNGGTEAAELVQELYAAAGVQLDCCELIVV